MTAHIHPESNQASSSPMQPHVSFQKNFTQDASFQIPMGAKAFQVPWNPELHVEISTETRKLAEPDLYHVSLKVHCIVRCEAQVVFTAEVTQSGIFGLHNLEKEQLAHCIQGYCPSLLYPFARETIGEMVLKGGFPQLSLSPMDFDKFQEKMDLSDQATQAHPEASSIN